MKLNNKGWGLSTLIIFGVIFILILVFISIRINSIVKYDKKNDNVDSEENVKANDPLYASLEEKLIKSGESYLIYHQTLLDNEDNYIIVSTDELKSEGHLANLVDPVTKGECDGFIKIDSTEVISPFISCQNYKTTDYDLWNE